MQIIDINGSERNCLKAYPDPIYPGYMRIEFKNHHEWFTIKEFTDFNPTLKGLTGSTPTMPDDDLGVVTKATSDTLTDVTKNWDLNSYVGFTTWISRGKGEGQQRLVVKNTHNTITIDKPWDTTPSKFSQYVLSHNTHDLPALGNTLPQEDMYKLEEESKKIDRKRGIMKPNEFYHPKPAKKSTKKSDWRKQNNRYTLKSNMTNTQLPTKQYFVLSDYHEGLKINWKKNTLIDLDTDTALPFIGSILTPLYTAIKSGLYPVKNKQSIVAKAVDALIADAPATAVASIPTPSSNFVAKSSSSSSKRLGNALREDFKQHQATSAESSLKAKIMAAKASKGQKGAWLFGHNQYTLITISK